MANHRRSWLWPRLRLQLLLLAALVCRDALGSPVLGLRGALRPSAAAPPRRLHGRFLHITDLHPDEFYKVQSSTDEDAACHRGKGRAGAYGAESSECDSPFSLINATFDWLAANVADSVDFVIWTGDSARHDSDERIPRSPSQVLGTNRWISDKFSEVFGGRGGAERRPAVPVVPTLGNNDILPHNILQPGPNKWLQYYTDIWRNFIPEEQRHSFEFGGWFYVEVIPNKLAVFSLNTLYFFDRNAGVDDCQKPSEPGFKQMEWLRIQLQFMRQRGMKAILMGHVPPARTQSKQLWHESCWQKYTLWLKQYRDVVVSGLYGHMNIDHFLLQDTHDVDILADTAPERDGVSVRAALEDELSIESTADYLRELREDWADLPQPAALDSGAEGSGKKGRGKPKKKKLGRWAHRYQLSLIAPSIVPNYFPTLRIIEYNISGMEDAATWADMTDPLPIFDEGEAQRQLELRAIPEVEAEAQKGKRKKGNKKKGHPKGGNKKGKPPKDPHLTIPDPPAKSSPPGPAYSPQPLTLTGYVQYYANLTRINADASSKSKVEGDRWLPGEHHDKPPKEKPVGHAEFQFEVEYSTFNDSIYNVTDLTVKSFVQLAYLMGQEKAKSDILLPPSEDSEEYDEAGAEETVDQRDTDGQDLSDPSGSDERLDLAKKKHGKAGGDKGKKDKKKSTSNKVWLHFLRHAFVSSVEENDLEKMFRSGGVRV